MELNKKTVVSLFIAFIMVFSIFGFILSSGFGPEKRSYNGFTFLQTQNGWMAKINNERIFFQYLPDEIQINIEDDVKNLLKEAKTLTITYDPQSSDAQLLAQIQFYAEDALKKQDKVYIIHALANSTGFDAQESNCKDSTETMPVLLLESAENTNIFKNDTCIVAQFGSLYDALQGIEEIIYNLLGVV